MDCGKSSRIKPLCKLAKGFLNVGLEPLWVILHFIEFSPSLILLSLWKQLQTTFFLLTFSFPLPIGMSNVVDAPPYPHPLPCWFGEKGGEGPWGRNVTEYVGEESEEEEEAGRCALCCCWWKSSPDRCISLSPAEPGDCLETSSIQPFFLCLCWLHQTGSRALVLS